LGRGSSNIPQSYYAKDWRHNTGNKIQSEKENEVLLILYLAHRQLLS